MQLSRRVGGQFYLAVVEVADTATASSTSIDADKTVKRVEDYSRAFGHRSVGILELCSKSDTAERTIHAAFNLSVGTSPSACLRSKRLNQAYKSLRHREPQRGMVKSVALQNGFNHYGRFAQQYRELFDERPSETLERR
ncbi:helix-turn-helix domain-containing protein [Shimia abyssi]|uniref:helix-turn-helix domain-containing protein n=1 Tax=Shimia abyssi TaxID=1662395 RepID=UPI000D0DD412